MPGMSSTPAGRWNTGLPGGVEPATDSERRYIVRSVVFAALVVLSAARTVDAGDDYSRLQAVGENGVVVDLPLEHTSVPREGLQGMRRC